MKRTTTRASVRPGRWHRLGWAICIGAGLYLGAFHPLLAAASTQYLVVPNGLEDQEGNAGAYFPFGHDFPERYQQLLDQTQLSDFPPGSHITELRFRQDGSPGSLAEAFDVVVPEIEVRLSTSPKTLTTLSLSYAENAGPDETVVFPRGSLHLSAGYHPSQLNPFEIVIPLSNPFPYDPHHGPLLLDILKYSPAKASRFDAHVFNEPVAFSALFGPVESSATDPDSLLVPGSGIVIQLGFTPIPEPAVLILLAAGGGLSATCRICRAFVQRRLETIDHVTV